MDPQRWRFLALTTNFRKFSNPATVLFLDSFGSYSEELLLIKLSFTLENFISKYQKVWDILSQTRHEMKKLESWGTFVTLVTHDRSKNLGWKFLYVFIKFRLKIFSHIRWKWQVYPTKFINSSQCFHRKKIWRSLCKNYKFCVIQRSQYSLFFIIPLLFKLALLLYKFIIKFWNSIVSCAKSIACLSGMKLKNCMFHFT